MKKSLLLYISLVFTSVSFAQVSQVADLNPGAVGSNAIPELTINGNLIISTWNAAWSATEIWSYNGTNAPTKLTQIDPSLIPGRYVHLLAGFNGKLYFTYGNPSGGYGEGLWEYDFVNAPTKILDSDPSAAEMGYSTINFNNKMYFACSDPTNGMELWTYDGVNTPTLAHDLHPSGSSSPSAFTLFQSKIYFGANDGTISYLYEYDGVNTPTVITNNLYYYGKPFPVNNNKLYFTRRTNNLTFSECVHEFDGTTVTLLNLPNVGEGLDYRSTEINSAHFGVLYFSVTEWATGQWKYWEYDFTNPAGPAIYPLHQAASHNNEVYFYHNGDSFGKELWKYNGTNATRLTDLNPTGDLNYVSNAYLYQNKIYFGASDEVTGTELWVYDPSFVGLNESMLNSINVYPNPANSFLSIDADQVIEKVSILDLNGAIVQRESTNKFSIETLTSGMYILKVETTDDIVTKRFTKN